MGRMFRRARMAGVSEVKKIRLKTDLIDFFVLRAVSTLGAEETGLLDVFLGPFS